MKTRVRTYTVLEISANAYEEIAEKLREAGDPRAFRETFSGRVLLDLQGITLGREGETAEPGRENPEEEGTTGKEETDLETDTPKLPGDSPEITINRASFLRP